MSGQRTPDSDFGNLLQRLAAWQIPAASIDRVHDLARVSLNEVKGLTEYEDGKVSRLLTVIAFLSAVVAAVFARFAGDYSVPPMSKPACTAAWILPAATYVTFLIYVLLVTFSVWRVIGAIRPKFVVPATWKHPAGQGGPTSMIFYKGILDTNAVEWGRTFEDQAAEDASSLKATYTKNYIAESYLVARKVADKLDTLRVGIVTLRTALLFLFLFVVCYGATIATLDPTRTASPPQASVAK